MGEEEEEDEEAAWGHSKAESFTHTKPPKTTWPMHATVPWPRMSIPITRNPASTSGLTIRTVNGGISIHIRDEVVQDKLTPGQNPENGVICTKTFSILLRGGTGARQGISQLIQHQYRLDLVSAGADISGRADEPRAGGCGRFGVGGGPPPARVEKRSQWSCCAVERGG